MQHSFSTHIGYTMRCDEGPSRNGETAFCQSVSTIQVHSAQLSGRALAMTLHIGWDDGKSSQCPASWLRVMAPLVAAPHCSVATKNAQSGKGWLQLRVLDNLLDTTAPGTLKVVDLPAPNIKEEQLRDHKDNIITRELKNIFGSVWVHPKRGADTTFNVSSHSDDAKRVELPNCDIQQVLLPQHGSCIL